MITPDNKLYESLRAEHQKFVNSQMAGESKELLVFPASTFSDVSQSLFSNLAHGGFCTLLVSGRADWNPSSFYYEAVREAARRGRAITRAFLLPMRSALHDKAFKQHWELDAKAGIKVEAYLIADLVSNGELSANQSLEFGIWDAAVACTSVRQGPTFATTQANEWRVTKRHEDLELLRALRATIEARAPKLTLGVSEPPSPKNLEEPMLLSAPLAYQLAPVLCRGSHIADDCSWYHSIWQYLRLFNMVSTPTWHADFYLKTLAEAFSGVQSPRVLISGTADYSMLAYTIAALGASVTDARITVVDLCDTPLLLCKWYAKFVGAQIETINIDILRFAENQQFDAIVTDAFLTRFDPQTRQQIVRHWYELLRPGGRAITTVRIEPAMTSDAVGSTKNEIDSFERRARVEAEKWQDFLTLTADQIETHARVYAQNMVSHSCRSVEEIAGVFANAQLEPNIVVEGVKGEMHSTQYARICARRTAS